MYTQPEDMPRRSKRGQFSAITFYTLLGFSLAGLLTGFVTGGLAGHFSHSADPGTSTPLIGSIPTISEHSPALKASPASLEDVFVAIPGLASGDYTSPQIADGTTSYHLAAQIVNKADQRPITVTDVTCRLWLTSDLQATSAGLSENDYMLPKSPRLFGQPFPDEIEGALAFSQSSPQTQLCAANGKTRWTYTLATSVPAGNYFLAVLADWKGIHYNWYFVSIAIRRAPQAARGAHYDHSLTQTTDLAEYPGPGWKSAGGPGQQSPGPLRDSLFRSRLPLPHW